MNVVERASRDMLAALVLDASAETGRVPDLGDLKAEYGLKINNRLLDSCIEPWENNGWLLVSRSHDGTSACLHDHRYGSAVNKLLEYLGADELELHSDNKMIVSDVRAPDWFPAPNGWVWVNTSEGNSAPKEILRTSEPSASTAPTFENARPLEESDQAIDSSMWTGLPSNFELTQAKQESLVRELEVAEDALSSLNLPQEIQAQARAYIVAARILAQAPEPPAELIWEIIKRADSLAGVASLFISIIALFA